MSSDIGGFTNRLEAIYEQHRQQRLEADLESVAEIMEQTLLECILAEEFLHIDATIDPDAKDAVDDARQLLDANQYDELSEMLPRVREAVETQERRVSSQTQQAQIDIRNTVQGMRRLNERVDRVDPERLEELEQLLESPDWTDRIDGDSTAARKENATAFAEEMRSQLEAAKSDLFGPYQGTPLEDLVDRLLDDERLTLAGLSEEELQRLHDSNLADYLEISLS